MTPASDLIALAERCEDNGLFWAEHAHRISGVVDYDALYRSAACFTVAAALRARASQEG
jgi:hypothetical protein